MFRQLSQVLPLLLVLLGTSACISRPRVFADGPEAMESCSGSVILDVRNNSSVNMEIIENREGSGAKVVIAIVGPGIAEIPIHREGEYWYSAQRAGGGPGTVATTKPRRAGVRTWRLETVTLNKVCKPGGGEKGGGGMADNTAP